MTPEERDEMEREAEDSLGEFDWKVVFGPSSIYKHGFESGYTKGLERGKEIERKRAEALKDLGEIE